MACYPWWHNTFLRYRGIRYPGGYSVPTDPAEVPSLFREQGLEDFVPIAPEHLRANAERQLRAMGIWTRAEALPLDVYSLARNIASETGTGSAEQKVAMGLSTVNQARRRGVSVHALVVLNNRLPNSYGRIHPGGDTSKAGMGRFTASSKEPTAEDIMIALFVLEGHAGTFPDDFAHGADDQAQVNSEGWVRSLAERRKYWVGPIPGVNHWKVVLYRTLPDVAPTSALGRQLVGRDLARLRVPAAQRDEVSADCIEVMPGSVTERIAEQLTTGQKIAVAGLLTVGALLAGVAVANLLPRPRPPLPRRRAAR